MLIFKGGAMLGSALEHFRDVDKEIHLHWHLSLHIVVSLKGRITCIWSFGCGFACATAMGCAGFRLLFGIIIVL